MIFKSFVLCFSAIILLHSYNIKKKIQNIHIVFATYCDIMAEGFLFSAFGFS